MRKAPGKRVTADRGRRQNSRLTPAELLVFRLFVVAAGVATRSFSDTQNKSAKRVFTPLCKLESYVL